MPTYQYSCTECGHFFEVFQSFSEDSLTVCPECAGQLRKVFNAVGVVFKGSGFYRTDSRKGPDTAANGSTSTKSTDSSPSTTTGTKSEAGSSSSTSGSGSGSGSGKAAAS